MKYKIKKFFEEMVLHLGGNHYNNRSNPLFTFLMFLLLLCNYDNLTEENSLLHCNFIVTFKKKYKIKNDM